MTFQLVYPATGRGAFPIDGTGGTLDLTGFGPGPYYRAPALGGPAVMPGLVAAKCVRYDAQCSINTYAVNRAVRALQAQFGATVDGVLGQETDAAIRAYQRAAHLIVDGVVGPKTTRTLYWARALDVLRLGTYTAAIQRAVMGTIGFESNWDLGAVGTTTPEDLGLGQINGPSHPAMSVDARFNPETALPWIVQFVTNNFTVMGQDEDAAILAYNLGTGGASSWERAGRPEVFHGTNTWAYIAKIKDLGG